VLFRSPRLDLNQRARIFAATYASNGGRAGLAYAACQGRTGDPRPGDTQYGSEWLARPEVAALLHARLSAIDAGSEATIAEIARIAMLDPAELFGEDGHLLPIREMPVDARRAICGLEMAVDKETGATLPSLKKIQLTGKIQALEMLAKIHRLYEQSITLRLEGLTQDELVARAKELIAKAEEDK
jgi:hypothetical protein